MKWLARIALLMSFALFCVNGADYQFRIPTHVQLVPGSKAKGIGFGGWLVLPDVTAKGNTFRALMVGGLLVRRENRWVEIMGGGILHQQLAIGGARKSPFFDPMVNVRASDRSIKRLQFFTDIELLPRTKRVYTLTSVDAPIPLRGLRKLRVRARLESENVFFWNGKPHSVEIGRAHV